MVGPTSFKKHIQTTLQTPFLRHFMLIHPSASSSWSLLQLYEMGFHHLALELLVIPSFGTITCSFIWVMFHYWRQFCSSMKSSLGPLRSWIFFFICLWQSYTKSKRWSLHPSLYISTYSNSYLLPWWCDPLCSFKMRNLMLPLT